MLLLLVTEDSALRSTRVVSGYHELCTPADIFLAHKTGQNDGATEYEAGVYLCHVWGGTCAH